MIFLLGLIHCLAFGTCREGPINLQNIHFWLRFPIVAPCQAKIMTRLLIHFSTLFYCTLFFFFLANLNFILFFKYKFIYFNWRLITLQYCIGFAIHQHTTGIHVFPIPKPPLSTLPYHPSGSSQHTSPKQPVSCTKLGLVICFMYDIIHVSMSFSQIIPPLPLPQSPKDCSTALLLNARLSGSWGYMFE